MSLPLATVAEFRGHLPPGLYKVASWTELASADFPLERCLFDGRGVTQDTSALRTLGIAGCIGGAGDRTADVRIGDATGIVKPGDVIDLDEREGRVHVRYRRGDPSNVLFATDRCNSYCLMCSQPPREVEDQWRVRQLCDLVSLIDRDEQNLCISGGEPTLLGEGLLEVIDACALSVPSAQLHILSNGRRLADVGYTDQFRARHPALSWGVPLYGDHAALHDYIVQRSGAFDETLRGLYALHRAEQRIEIRIVLVKPAVARLTDIARYLYRNLPFVDHVALMGIEPTGFAKAHYDALWVDPADMADILADTVEWLGARGIPASLYNLPLCTLPKRAWAYARQSISPWKQDYDSVCAACAVRSRCAGFFTWTTAKWRSRAIAPITEEPAHA